HGLFTYHLLRGIAGAADRDGDGWVGVAELFNYVSAAVAHDAREKFGLVQQPWTSATWTHDVFLAKVPPRAGAAGGDSKAVERLWREAGPAAAIAELEGRVDDEDEQRLRSVLQVLGARRHPAAIPLLFHCLAHRSRAIRRRAKTLVQAFGWES